MMREKQSILLPQQRIYPRMKLDLDEMTGDTMLSIPFPEEIVQYFRLEKDPARRQRYGKS